MTSTELPSAAHHGGRGSPLLLLHGLFMTWHAWLPVLDRLEQHHEVLAPTLAGHRGGPALTRRAEGIAPLADAVEQQLDERGWDRVHVVGNSLGGWLSLELAQRGRAASVVAFSPAGTSSGPLSRARLIAQLRAIERVSGWTTTDRMLARGSLRSVVMRSAVARHQDVTYERAAQLLHDARSCTALTPLLEWIREHGSLSPYDVGRTPVRIAWPLRDRTIPWERHGVAFQALVPTAEFVRLPGVGHVPMTDDPELVARTILEFTHGATRFRSS